MPMIDAKTAADRLAEMRANPPSTPTLYKDHDATWQNAYAYAMGDARSALANLATSPAPLPHDESVGAGARAPMNEAEERIEEGQRPGGRHGGRWHDPDEELGPGPGREREEF